MYFTVFSVGYSVNNMDNLWLAHCNRQIRYTGDMQPNEVAAPLFWNAALIDSPEAHNPRNL